MKKKWSWKSFFTTVGMILSAVATVITAVIKIVSCFDKGKVANA